MPNKYSAPPAMAIDPNKTYTATMKTSRGEIVLELFAKDAPKTVNNFVFLAKDKFYDGLNFHRVINDFMVQGGCPQGSGSGGPGYKFEDEVTGRANQSHKPGVISMANAGPGTNGSQFFITHVDCSYLDPKHTVFGKVTKGKDIVDSVKQGDKIESITITEA
jgi:peptidyl-prolyl cis-trans isomerase B (cyclophilin B)